LVNRKVLISSSMSWKFKVSKYKNAAPRHPKKEVTYLLSLFNIYTVG